MPDKSVTIVPVATTNNIKEGLAKKLIVICTLSNLFKKGKAIVAIVMASSNAAKTITDVSLKNWMPNCFRLLPRTFLTPTSFERLTACAVARFMKFTHAIKIRKIPINDNALIKE